MFFNETFELLDEKESPRTILLLQFCGSRVINRVQPILRDTKQCSTTFYMLAAISTYQVVAYKILLQLKFFQETINTARDYGFGQQRLLHTARRKMCQAYRARSPFLPAYRL